MNAARVSSLAAAIGGAVILFACSGSSARSGFDNGSSGSSGDNSSGGGGFGNGDDGGPGGAACAPDPKNAEIPGNNCDDDGDGKVDNPPTCDTGLGSAAEDMAKSMGICANASDKGYGLVSATFVQGNASQRGVLGKFGSVIKPREGASLGVLSSGYAKEYDGSGTEPFGGATGTDILSFQLNGKDWNENASIPSGFPKPAKGCQQATDTHDVSWLKLELKAPPNAAGIKFDFNFYSGEWPAYVCSRFNDGFIAYLSSKGFNKGAPDNMSFDKDGNPVSVNNGFFDRCTPGVQTQCASMKDVKSVCPGGPAELGGTGFGQTGQWCDPFMGSDTSTDGGATGWLTSQAPVQAGETFTIEFIIWDTGDGFLDSSVLLDNFTWVAGQVTGATTDRPH